MKKKKGKLWSIIGAIVVICIIGNAMDNFDTKTNDVPETNSIVTESEYVPDDSSDVAIVEDKSEVAETKAKTKKEAETKKESKTKKETFSDSKVLKNNTQTKVNYPKYDGNKYAVINNNIPGFTTKDLTTKAFESYSDLDKLGRCGVAYANVCIDIMPTEERGAIGSVKPSGWHTVKYDIVNGKYLYNRCHLIGYQLSAENANEKNLITGTRYFNVQGMLPFENMVADYVKETNNHVLYRVTPVFEGNNLLASGVQMEAYSVEDDGDGICFNVYCFNVQPGVEINYATGDSKLSGQQETTKANKTVTKTTKKVTATEAKTHAASNSNSSTVYVSKNGIIHSKSNCSGMKYYTEMSYDNAVAGGYKFCSKCN